MASLIDTVVTFEGPNMWLGVVSHGGTGVPGGAQRVGTVWDGARHGTEPTGEDVTVRFVLLALKTCQCQGCSCGRKG